MVPARQALERLREGNARFVAHVRDGNELMARRTELKRRQEPSAIILGCADARVPAELVFDQGLGDLFVIRVAGNVVAPSLVGSVEFAADRFGTRLVVVLGHTECGAIEATIEALTRPGGGRHSRNVRDIVDRIRPAVQGLLDGAPLDPAELALRAVRMNIRASADHLRHGSRLLEQLIADDGLLVVGAEYCLATGEVDFFDGVQS